MSRVLLIVALILASTTMMSMTWAQEGPLDLSWYTIDGGGTTASSGGEFVLSGTVGQPDAGWSSGGTYTVRGGFWGLRSAVPPPPENHQLYLPLIRR